MTKASFSLYLIAWLYAQASCIVEGNLGDAGSESTTGLTPNTDSRGSDTDQGTQCIRAVDTTVAPA